MSYFLDHCCLKFNYLLCGSNEQSSSSTSKKKKFKIRQQDNNNKNKNKTEIIHRNEPISIKSFEHHYVNVTPIVQHSIREQNSINRSPRYENLSRKQSSLSSSIDHHQSSSLSTNGILIKDIILHRTNPNERLGLTLCYGLTSNSTSTTNIYIQQIDEKSLASEQGELRSGDQIIKINNHHVTSRDQAINLINGTRRVILQILRLEFPQTTLPFTEEDSGVILPHSIKSSLSLSLSALNQFSHSNFSQSRRCLSLNDVRFTSMKPFVHSQSLFGTTTDNEELILKPLPFDYYTRRRDDSDSGLVCQRSRSNDSHRSYSSNRNQWTMKSFRRRCREQRLREQQYQLTTDDEPMSELKQGKYWTRQQRKEHLIKARQYRQRAKFFQQHSIVPYSDSTTEDFNLLNRIFLRENQSELKSKPFLAHKYQQHSSIERNRLKRMINEHYFIRMKSPSNTTRSLSSTLDQSSMIVL